MDILINVGLALLVVMPIAAVYVANEWRKSRYYSNVISVSQFLAYRK